MSSITACEIPGGWTQRTVHVSGRAFDLIVPARPDEFLNQLDESRVGPEADPYWAELWSAAVPLAEAVLHADGPTGAEALELGAGIGLVGLAAAAKGLRVTVSDYVPTAVELALENARRNGFGSLVRGCVLDWRRPRAERFPIILASDVLYDAGKHDCLLDVLEHMLAADGVCWIGDPGRYHFRAFLHRASDRGFAVRIRDQQGNELCGPQDGAFQIVVLRFGQGLSTP